MRDLIIIGGGPAGITAGIYAARKKMNTLLLTGEIGGSLANAGEIENWPGEESIRGPKLLSKFQKHLDCYDLDVKNESMKEIAKKNGEFKIKTEEETYRSKIVIVATGRKPRKLEVEGEEEFTGKGVAYCVTCDAPLFSGKSVVVVGGGNTGLEGALELTDHADSVTILEVEDSLQADEYLIDRAKENEKINIFCKTAVEEIKGDDFVNSIVYKDLENDKEREMEIDGVFIEIGSIPNSSGLPEEIKTDSGEIDIDFETCETEINGLFGAGDVTTVRDKQIVVATGEGAKAAISAYQYLSN